MSSLSAFCIWVSRSDGCGVGVNFTIPNGSPADLGAGWLGVENGLPGDRDASVVVVAGFWVNGGCPNMSEMGDNNKGYLLEPQRHLSVIL